MSKVSTVLWSQQKYLSGLSGMQYRSVVFPSTFKEIAPCGFAESGIKYINIPPVITAIPEKAFAECSKLEKVYLHENVRSLEKEAFYFCSNLTKMNLYHVPEIFESTVRGTPYKSYHTLYYVGGKLRQRKPWWRWLLAIVTDFQHCCVPPTQLG